MDLSRRDVLGSSLASLAGRAATSAANAQEASTYGAAPTGLGITSALARFLSGIRYEDCRLRRYTRRSAPCSTGSGCALAEGS